jgi:molecular chaperone IbpA
MAKEIYRILSSDVNRLPELVNRFNRSVIGGDAMFNFTDNVNFPPYNLEKLGEDEYLLTLALAGYSKEDLSITVDNGCLLIDGTNQSTDEETDSRVFIHKGIAARSFTREFRLMEHIVVDSADLNNGLLSIKLKRIVPEHLKPKLIEIN